MCLFAWLVCWLLCSFVCLFSPAFTRLGHECRSLLSSCDGLYTCTDCNDLASQGVVSEPTLIQKGKTPSTGQLGAETTRDAAGQ